MGYQALYRRYRPARFEDFVGQEAVIKTLRSQITSGRIAHAYLFCGTRGTGKTSTAKVFARAVNCEHPENGDPCGTCDTCRALAEENSLDILEIDAASNNGVDEIRDLREKVKSPPQTGRYRVYIIDEVHMLSQGAFNALLKTLEEPPAYVVFILATTEPQKLPATILSRCQRFDFGRIPAHQIIGRLRVALEEGHIQAEDAALSRIARAAEGGMRDAWSIMDMCLSYAQEEDGGLTEALVLRVLGAADKSFLFAFADRLIDSDAAGALALSLGIAIQNFPEGAIISMPLRAEGESKGKAFLGGVLSGVVEPIGAVLTILAAQLVIPALPYFLSFAAGAMLYVVVEELIPEMSQGKHSNIGTIFFAVGFSVMMTLDVALG